MKCPMCNKGKLNRSRIKEIISRISLGEFPAYVCNKCGESFTNKDTTKKIEKIAKEKGVWGIAC